MTMEQPAEIFSGKAYIFRNVGDRDWGSVVGFDVFQAKLHVAIASRVGLMGFRLMVFGIGILIEDIQK